MAKLSYAVLQIGDEWRVVSGRRRMGHFSSKTLAIAAGVRLAREAMATGHQVEFLVQDQCGYLLEFDIMPMAAHIDARQGGTPQPADAAPEPPGVRALEL